MRQMRIKQAREAELASICEEEMGWLGSLYDGCLLPDTDFDSAGVERAAILWWPANRCDLPRDLRGKRAYSTIEEAGSDLRVRSVVTDSREACVAALKEGRMWTLLEDA